MLRRISANGFMKKQQNSKATGQQKATPTTKKKLLPPNECAPLQTKCTNRMSRMREKDFILYFTWFSSLCWIRLMRALVHNTYFLIIHLNRGFCCRRRNSNCVHFVHRLSDNLVLLAVLDRPSASHSTISEPPVRTSSQFTSFFWFGWLENDFLVCHLCLPLSLLFY